MDQTERSKVKIISPEKYVSRNTENKAVFRDQNVFSRNHKDCNKNGEWDFEMIIFGFVNFEMVGKIGYWDRIELVLLYSVIKKKFEKKYLKVLFSALFVLNL